MAEAERVALAAWGLLWTLGSKGEHATQHLAPKRKDMPPGDDFRHAFKVPQIRAYFAKHTFDQDYPVIRWYPRQESNLRPFA